MTTPDSEPLDPSTTNATQHAGHRFAADSAAPFGTSVGAGIGTLPGVDRLLPQFVAHGITGVRNMNDATVDVTFGPTKEVERQVAEGE